MRALSVLSESQSLALAQLEIKRASGGLSDAENWRHKELSTGTRPRLASVGARIATSREYKALAVKAAGTSDRVALDQDYPLRHSSGAEFKALVTGVSDTSAGAFITNQRDSFVSVPRRRLRVLDLVNVQETTVDAIEFARQTTYTNVVAEVAEATSTTTGTKPEATIAFEKVTAAVKDYSAWVPVTRRGLADVAEMRSLVDAQLQHSARLVLEAAVVADMVTAAGQTQAKGADTLPVAVLKLLTKLRTAEIEPTAVLLNPVDYEVLRSVTTAYSSPVITVDSDGTERIYGVPIVISAAVADDTAVIGDMSAVSVWLRSAEMFVSTSHASYFTFNLAALLCDFRAAFGVTQPAGIGTVTGWD